MRLLKRNKHKRKIHSRHRRHRQDEEDVEAEHLEEAEVEEVAEELEIETAPTERFSCDKDCCDGMTPKTEFAKYQYQDICD